MEVIVLLFLTLVSLGSELVLSARLFQMLNTYDFKFCIKRSACVFTILVVVSLLGIAIINGVIKVFAVATTKGVLDAKLSMILTPLSVCLLTMIMLVVFFLLTYAIHKYMNEQDAKLSLLFNYIKKAIQNIGYIVKSQFPFTTNYICRDDVCHFANDYIKW